MNTLHIDSLTIQFGDRKILSGAYLKCQTGSITGLLGHNGSGKSSLLKVIFGTLLPDFVYMSINGKPQKQLYKQPSLISYLPQFDFLPSDMSVSRIVKWFNCEDRIFTVDEMQRIRDRKIYELSGGQRRLVQTYAVLFSNSKFALLDEPFTHISPVQVEELSTQIKKIKNEKGIIITDHLYEHVINLSDSLMIIQHERTFPINCKEDLIDRGYLR
ncbi:ATP-binding cassette domain-containing protein [Solitalea lacus]|uniref:ATP-binding cassette domain-containing protein n=1 Tax=Solitalea lacus TaxID=2911172 RepID=UPI001EDC3FF8|nr:ATP-binding cassette domain-containing protein [Solitalea lacus]UKJ06033.1 ATP-binding cassette domain-containing protein [Solitalea lacus]